MLGHCAILDGVKIQVGLKMKDAGSRSYPESDSVEWRSFWWRSWMSSGYSIYGMCVPAWGITKLWRSVGGGCRHWPLGPIEVSSAVAVVSTIKGEHWSKEGDWSVEGVMMMSLTPQDPGPIDQECDSHDPWCLPSWHEYVSEDGVFVERRRRWWMREMITSLTPPLPSLISTFIHFPFVFPYSYWRVQPSHIHNSHSNPLGTPQRRRKCMITHWRGHFTHYISLSKVLVGCSHRIECVVMVACAIWDSYAWFVMIAPGRSCAVCDISQCHRMKWDAQS